MVVDVLLFIRLNVGSCGFFRPFVFVCQVWCVGRFNFLRSVERFFCFFCRALEKASSFANFGLWVGIERFANVLALGLGS